MKKIFTLINRYLIAWVVCWSIIAYFLPAPFIKIKGYLEYFFALTMFCVGSLVSTEHMKFLLKKPLRVGTGTFLQFSIMPFIAFLTSLLFKDPEVRTGIILTGCVPGAMASNLMSALADADVALSVSITTLSTLLSPIVTPVFLYLLAGSFIKIKFLSMFFKLMWMVVIPVVSGYIVKLQVEELVDRSKEFLSGIAALAIIVIVAIVVAENRSNLLFSYSSIALALFIPNIAGYISGFYITNFLKWPLTQQKTVSLEVGMQNAGLGTVLALGYFGEVSAIPPAIYTVLCLVTSAILVTYWKKRR